MQVDITEELLFNVKQPPRLAKAAEVENKECQTADKRCRKERKRINKEIKNVPAAKKIALKSISKVAKELNAKLHKLKAEFRY